MENRQKMKVPFSSPDCCEDEIQEVTNVIRSGWLTTASRCKRFEKEFAEFIGAKHALAINSATAALHLALEATGIRKCHQVLVPTFTFTATAEVIRYLGADPIFVDCDRETFCITPLLIEDAIERFNLIISEQFSAENTLLDLNSKNEFSVKAIIPVHFGGHPCEIDKILKIAESKGQKVIEDAAHSLPTKFNGQFIGSFGDATCFSFYANKTITTGEGGMLCTDDDELAKRIEIMRLHGIDRDIWDRFSIGASWEYDVIAPGFKYNMPDICAAIGIHQLRKAGKLRERRQTIAEVYYDELKDIPGLILPKIRCKMGDHAWYLFNILIEPKDSLNCIDRNKFIKEMTERGIGTSVHYKPLHRMTYYKEKYDLSPDMFPNAEWVFQRCVCLPIFSAMTDEQLEYVIKTVKNILL